VEGALDPAALAVALELAVIFFFPMALRKLLVAVATTM
jgi:hypothetical protein